MLIKSLGRYRWLKDVHLRGPNCVETRAAGTEFEVTSLDTIGHQIHGPDFPDWQYWNQPCEPVIQAYPPSKCIQHPDASLYETEAEGGCLRCRMQTCNPPPPEVDGDDWQRNTIAVSGNIIRFDAESYCIVHLRPNSDVVQMMSNIADKACASRYAAQVENDGGHVFAAVPAGVLVAAVMHIKPEARRPGKRNGG